MLCIFIIFGLMVNGWRRESIIFSGTSNMNAVAPATTDNPLHTCTLYRLKFEKKVHIDHVPEIYTDISSWFPCLPDSDKAVYRPMFWAGKTNCTCWQREWSAQHFEMGQKDNFLSVFVCKMNWCDHNLLVGMGGEPGDGESILPSWLLCRHVFFLQISVRQQLFLWTQVIPDKPARHNVQDYLFNAASFIWMNVSQGIKRVQLCWKQSHSSNSNVVA